MTTHRIARRLAALVLCGIPAAAATAGAQEPPAAPRFTIGPLMLYPRLEMREVGWDDNVFNEAENPQSDFTATITPRVNAELRTGKVRTSVVTFVDFVYFNKFEGERAVNRAVEARFEIAEGILQPFVIGSILDTHDRVNAEIDARAGRRLATYGGGLSVMLTSRTALVVSGRRSDTDFDEDEVFNGVDLSRTMSSTVDTIDTTLRMALTPLTTWTTSGLLHRERFEAEPQRDADSVIVSTALEFNPSALIAGRASVGYRNFDPLDNRLPAFDGVVSQVGLIYSLEGTRVEGTFEHDLRYSFEELQPYYVTTNGRLVITQRVAGPVDVQGIVGRILMRYRQYDEGEAEVRRDRATLYGGGLGYRLGDTARLGMNVEWSHRRSDQQPDRQYDRRRVFASLTYGF